MSIDDKSLRLLFANISARKLRHSHVTNMLRWYQVSVNNFKKYFIVIAEKRLKILRFQHRIYVVIALHSQIKLGEYMSM